MCMCVLLRGARYRMLYSGCRGPLLIFFKGTISFLGPLDEILPGKQEEGKTRFFFCLLGVHCACRLKLAHLYDLEFLTKDSFIFIGRAFIDARRHS